MGRKVSLSLLLLVSLQTMQWTNASPLVPDALRDWHPSIAQSQTGVEIGNTLKRSDRISAGPGIPERSFFSPNVLQNTNGFTIGGLARMDDTVVSASGQGTTVVHGATNMANTADSDVHLGDSVSRIAMPGQNVYPGSGLSRGVVGGLQGGQGFGVATGFVQRDSANADSGFLQRSNPNSVSSVVLPSQGINQNEVGVQVSRNADPVVALSQPPSRSVFGVGVPPLGIAAISQGSGLMPQSIFQIPEMDRFRRPHFRPNVPFNFQLNRLAAPLAEIP